MELGRAVFEFSWLFLPLPVGTPGQHGGIASSVPPSCLRVANVEKNNNNASASFINQHLHWPDAGSVFLLFLLFATKTLCSINCVRLESKVRSRKWLGQPCLPLVHTQITCNCLHPHSFVLALTCGGDRTPVKWSQCPLRSTVGLGKQWLIHFSSGLPPAAYFSNSSLSSEMVWSLKRSNHCRKSVSQAFVLCIDSGLVNLPRLLHREGVWTTLLKQPCLEQAAFVLLPVTMEVTNWK